MLKIEVGCSVRLWGILLPIVLMHQIIELVVLLFRDNL